MRRFAFVLAVLALPPPSALADDGLCKIVDVDFRPQELVSAAIYKPAPQIVVWIEDTAGNYVDTVFLTQQTGTYGLGNRPGRADFNSGPKWPYGRRLGVFPVWAHRHGLTFDEVQFQDGNEDNLSHAFSESSVEMHFCRPLATTGVDKPLWDAGTCASAVFTDKGKLTSAKKTLYPPRNDLVRASTDHPAVDLFATLNPFDAVSQPTPPMDQPAQVTWSAPDTVPEGNYVLWVEVSREFDHNATYSEAARPSPTGIPWSDYGAAFRGQPSTVYKVPFTIVHGQRVVAHALDYIGYGDPDGIDGNVRPPDSTISTGVAGSGAERLAVQSDAGTPYRVRVNAFTETDAVEPAAPGGLAAKDVSTTSARITFKAPGDDGVTGRVRRYEIRYKVGKNFTENTFGDGIEIKPDLVLGDAGATQDFTLKGLLNGTDYTVGIRAYDDCLNKGNIAFVTFRTPDRAVGEVDWCFVATAAYGTALANDVEMLRRFRDMVLQSTVLGELAVEAYYTFGPAVAGVVGESELLRATARAVLDPLVETVKVLRF
ncbi:MAG TPA: fibronectin type III domain-containing protein [Kofleriaceae bacterium]|nr:fibronectin type III domain-containing protein [Kofleriaceae bacterium]